MPDLTTQDIENAGTEALMNALKIKARQALDDDKWILAATACRMLEELSLDRAITAGAHNAFQKLVAEHAARDAWAAGQDLAQRPSACPTCGSTDPAERRMVGCGFKCDDPRRWHAWAATRPPAENDRALRERTVAVPLIRPAMLDDTAVRTFRCCPEQRLEGNVAHGCSGELGHWGEHTYTTAGRPQSDN